MPRIFWGLLLIAIGVGALLDIELWPLVLIVVGVALLLPVLTGRRRHRNWHQMWWCWWDPSYWRKVHERSRQEEREGRQTGS